MAKVNLEEINDKQKLLLTQLAYLNISSEGFKAIEEGITIRDLQKYLSAPDSFVYGDLGGQNATEEMAKVLIGDAAYQTDKELLQEMIDNGLGDVSIKGWINDPKTGLQAAAFQDTAGHTGISYRGSDFDQWAILNDWGIADGAEFVTDSQHQLEGAQKFFDDMKTSYTYIYGHSLGGNLVSYISLNNPDDVTYAFSFNGNPIDEKLIKTDAQKEFFKSDKFDFTVVCGDMVGHFKEHGDYNVRYIENSKVGRENPIQAHLPQAAALDESGNFKYATEEQMLEYMNPQAQSAANWMHDVKDLINGLKDGEINIIDLCKEAGSDILHGDFKFNGLKESIVDMDDLFKSENSQHQNLDIGLMARTGGELFIAGVKGAAKDCYEFVENGVDFIKDSTEAAKDLANDILDRGR